MKKIPSDRQPPWFEISTVDSEGEEVEGLAYEHELELFSLVGRRVRCVNQSRFHGLLGTIVLEHSPYWVLIEWDGHGEHNLQEDNTHGGTWSEGNYEFVEEEEQQPQISDRELALENVVRMAQNVFKNYAEQHLAKGTPEGWMKAITNIGMVSILQNALDTDS